MTAIEKLHPTGGTAEDTQRGEHPDATLLRQFSADDFSADDEVAVTVHRDSCAATDNHLELRYLLSVRIADGTMAEAWEVPSDRSENDRSSGARAATSARLAAGHDLGR